MDLNNAINFAPSFVLVFFRMAGLMVMSPLFGSTRIPRRVKVLFASVAAFGAMTAIDQPLAFPGNLFDLILAIAGEICFGLAMGLIVSFTFIAAQWAGEMIGQQMGFNLSEVFDPQYGQAGSLVGDLYFMLTLVIFLSIGGHRMLVGAVHESLITSPPLSLVFNESLFQAILDMFTTATVLALRLAAPMFFTMLVVDVAMGTISRAMPQFNVMSAGLSIRALMGMGELLVGIVITSDALMASLTSQLELVADLWGGHRGR
jgi:flagellar biosynthetic protein FliR